MTHLAEFLSIITGALFIAFLALVTTWRLAAQWIERRRMRRRLVRIVREY